MEILTSPSPLFPFLKSPSNSPTHSTLKVSRVSIKSPPPEFDYRSEIGDNTRSAVAAMHPELLDLVEKGRLVLIEKRRFGPVPSWRNAFVEPEAIWLVGTSHISEESAADVERVVRAVRPESVVVELCRSRAGIMYVSDDDERLPLLRSNMFSLSGARFWGAIGRSINLGGQTALALRLLLAVFSSKISSNSNRPFGDEFRAARRSSEEIGAQIVLGDRPIEITLGRAWSSLKWSEKLSLVLSILRGISSPSLDASGSNLKDQEMEGSPFQLYELLSFSYPSLLQPLVHERDTYLAWSLKRSKAVNKSKSVVGVIGRGHMNGVIYALVSDQGDLRFRDLVGQRPFGDGSNGWIKTILKSLIRDTVIGIIAWVLFEQLKTALL
ncbi:uncharacterized protein LOC131248489 isoform X2 [Magnolia sinica]|uniref:uncharacterized protein LOC131248489 isoform X2 n=2 Tax=Magnolia sinica TaxID=86752 RepID=UPI00265902B8|nr:uncharacterized protein LOC131248489 isoform X2 [Magnolia sinica]